MNNMTLLTLKLNLISLIQTRNVRLIQLLKSQPIRSIEAEVEIDYDLTIAEKDNLETDKWVKAKYCL